MKTGSLKRILQRVARGRMEVDDALAQIRQSSFEDLGFAKLDHHRELRTGVPEVIFAPGKSEEQVIKIFERMQKAGSDIIITRAEKNLYDRLKRRFKGVRYEKTPRMILKLKPGRKRVTGDDQPIGTPVSVVSAGTADLTVAEEAAVTVEAFGQTVERIYDVGVAGIHRLLAFQEKLQKSRVVIVVAGMEGALASVVGGLVTAPVIAVPTSVGYGASFGGIGALLAMLNSCAPGVVVVNIDNGFGAAMAALKIVRRTSQAK